MVEAISAVSGLGLFGFSAFRAGGLRVYELQAHG